MLINRISFFMLSSSVKSGLLAVLLDRSHSMFPSCFPLFPKTFPFSHLSLYHFVSVGNIPLSVALCTSSTFYALSCLPTYSDPASCLHPANKCCAVSLNSPHNLHLSWSTSPLIIFHAFVSIICSCHVNINAVFLGSVLYFSHP